MVDHLALLDAVDAYADALLNSYEIGDVLFRLTDQVVTVLGVDGAGVSLAQEGEELRPVAATGTAMVALQNHLVNGRGPSVAAWASGDQVTIDDVTIDTRWPEHNRIALEHDCRSIAALPMPVEAKRLGALEMVRHDAHTWTELEVRVAQVLANMASGYVLNNATLEESRTLSTQLKHALDSRVIVEQAKGMLTERAGITPIEAFELLRRHARTNQVRVHDVCRQLIDGTLDLSAELPDKMAGTAPLTVAD